jgi:hypothetical protein
MDHSSGPSDQAPLARLLRRGANLEPSGAPGAGA